jgi:hypothetical protein
VTPQLDYNDGVGSTLIYNIYGMLKFLLGIIIAVAVIVIVRMCDIDLIGELMKLIGIDN